MTLMADQQSTEPRSTQRRLFLVIGIALALLALILARIITQCDSDDEEQAARRSGRRADEVTLVAVSKTKTAEDVRAGFEAGLRVFG